MIARVTPQYEAQPWRVATTQHTRIDHLLEAVLNATSSDDPRDLPQSWAELEKELLDHLDFEETEIFPKAERHLPATVARLRQEHRRIRELVCRLGVTADLHALGRWTALELIELLRVHAAHEEMTLYPLSRSSASEAPTLLPAPIG